MQRVKLRDLKRLQEERYNYPPAIKPKKFKYTACGAGGQYDHNAPAKYQRCWEVPKDMISALKFGPCWDYEPTRYKRRPLPPPCRGTYPPLNSIVPTFEHCGSIYTHYDYRLEECAHQQVLVVEKLFRELDNQLKEERALQIKVTENMLNKAIRYNLLIHGGPCFKTYPEYLSKMAEDRALCYFQKGHNAIQQSNCNLSALVKELQDARVELRKRISVLDRTLPSKFLLGDGYGYPSLTQVEETIENVYSYFFGVISKLNRWAQLIDAAQEFSIRDYLALLTDKSDFSSFMEAGLEKCTCKRCDMKNPFGTYLPCWQQRMQHKDKQLRTYQCDVKIETKTKFSDDSVESSSTVPLDSDPKKSCTSLDSS